MSWISVKDRLPMCFYECADAGMDISKTVMVSNEDSYPSIGFAHIRDDGKWVVYKGEYDFMMPDKITHWMPTPSHPKDES